MSSELIVRRQPAAAESGAREGRNPATMIGRYTATDEHRGNVAVIDLCRRGLASPAVADAPSDLIIIGRYVLTPDVFDAIAELRPGAGGELQLTDALRVQAATGPFHGVVRDVRRYDTGNPVGWLGAVVELALGHAKYGEAFRAELARILS